MLSNVLGLYKLEQISGTNMNSSLGSGDPMVPISIQVLRTVSFDVHWSADQCGTGLHSTVYRSV